MSRALVQIPPRACPAGLKILSETNNKRPGPDGLVPPVNKIVNSRGGLFTGQASWLGIKRKVMIKKFEPTFS